MRFNPQERRQAHTNNIHKASKTNLGLCYNDNFCTIRPRKPKIIDEF